MNATDERVIALAVLDHVHLGHGSIPMTVELVATAEGLFALRAYFPDQEEPTGNKCYRDKQLARAHWFDITHQMLKLEELS